MRQVQQRIVSEMDRLARFHPDEDLALFSHGDVIKAALCAFLGMSLDSIQTIDLGPGGVAVLDLSCTVAALRALRQNDDLFADGCCTLAGDLDSNCDSLHNKGSALALLPV